MRKGVNVCPIRTDDDLDAALARVNEIFFAKAGTKEADERDVLATLIEAYEDEHYPILPSDPIEALKFWMDQNDLSQADLVPYMGASSRVSEVLSGKRSLTVKMIRALHDGLGIPTDSLIGTTPSRVA